MEKPVECKKNLWKEIRDYSISIGIALVLAVLFRNYVISSADVSGRSMASTLKEKDVLLVEKISNLTKAFKKGEIITFDSNNLDNDVFVKRIIATEGDVIMIKNGNVYLNGDMLEETYLNSNMTTSEGTFLKEGESYTVPGGCVFVMGDNRRNSLDSRNIGPVEYGRINGHVIFRLLPMKSMRVF